MAQQLKINKPNPDDDFIRDDTTTGEQHKMFANKKANIALIALGVAIALAFVAYFIIKVIPAEMLA